MDYKERQALDWLALNRSTIQYGIDSSGIWATPRDSLEQEIRFDTYEQAAKHFGWKGPVSEGRLQQLAQEWMSGQSDVKWWKELHLGSDTGWILAARGAAPETRYPSFYKAAKDLGWKGVGSEEIRAPDAPETLTINGYPPPEDPVDHRREILFDPYGEVAARTRLELAMHRSVIQYGIDCFRSWAGSRDPLDPVPCPDPLFAAHLRTLEARDRVLDPQPSPSDDEAPCSGCGQRYDENCTCFRSYEDWEMGGL